jgi:hypothetical protein
MDDAERERFLATLRTDAGFRAAVRRELLTDELLNLPEVVARLTITVEALVDAVAQQRQDFTALTQSMANHQAQMIDAVDRLQAAMLDGFKTVFARFDAVDARFDGFDARLGGFDARLGGVDARFDRIDARFDAVDAGFVAVQARFDQIGAELQDIRDQLAS